MIMKRTIISSVEAVNESTVVALARQCEPDSTITHELWNTLGADQVDELGKRLEARGLTIQDTYRGVYVVDIEHDEPNAVDGYRVFRGRESRQLNAYGNALDPHAWYYEPSDYEGDVVFDTGFATRAEAERAARRHAMGIADEVTD